MSLARRGRSVRIAHAEVDDVAPGGARLRFQGVHLGEDIERKAFNAVEIFGHRDQGAADHTLLAGNDGFGEATRRRVRVAARSLYRDIGRLVFLDRGEAAFHPKGLPTRHEMIASPALAIATNTSSSPRSTGLRGFR